MSTFGIRVISCCEILIVFVDGIVSQVDKGVVETLEFELLCSEPGKAFSVHEDPQRIDICHQDIDSEVKFVLVY
jgi:hypothetical protein